MSAPDGMIITSAKGKIVAANHAAARIFDVDTHGVLAGKMLAKVLKSAAPEHASSILRTVSEGLRQQTTPELETTLRRRDYHEMTVSIIGQRITNGTEYLYLYRFRDLAGSHRLGAQQAREDLLTILTGLYHNMGNFIAAVCGAAQTWTSECTPAQTASIMDVIARNSSNLRGILARIKAQIQGHKHKPEPHHLWAMVSEVAMGRSRPHITVDIEPCNRTDLWAAVVDDSAIKDVLANLIINAVQAIETTKKSGRVMVSAENLTVHSASGVPVKPGNYLLVHVSDNGPGMSPEVMEKIFLPFFSTKKKTDHEGGWGIGLTFVRMSILQHGGHIAVESHPGKGTTFSIYLPADSSITLASDGISEL